MIKIPQSSIDRFHDLVDQVFTSGNIAEGMFRKKVEEKFLNEITNAQSVTLVNSNGAGILALLNYYADVENRDRVLIQSNTMYGLGTIPGVLNMNISVAPSRTDTFAMDHVALEEYFQDDYERCRETIVIFSHIGGSVASNIEEVADVCRRYGVPLIEDCAHSLGAQTKLYGDAMVFSLYATKAVPAGEGGIIITRDNRPGDWVKRYIMYDRTHMCLTSGVNLRVSEVQACFIWSVLQDMDAIISNRMNTYREYERFCRSHQILHMEAEGPNGQDKFRHNGYKFIITDRQVINYFAKKGKIQSKGEYSGDDILTGTVFGYSLKSSNDVIDHICLNTNYDVAPKLIKDTLEMLKEAING